MQSFEMSIEHNLKNFKETATKDINVWGNTLKMSIWYELRSKKRLSWKTLSLHKKNKKGLLPNGPGGETDILSQESNEIDSYHL